MKTLASTIFCHSNKMVRNLHTALKEPFVVELNTPIQPGTSTTFDMEFESQVPKQVRRSGKQNAEGVEFS